LLRTERSSSAKVCAELALEPLKNLITTVGPEMEESSKVRQTQIIDYDSYRRRVKVCFYLNSINVINNMVYAGERG
jgi:endonuclease YncB( thermonuclease family)